MRVRSAGGIVFLGILCACTFLRAVEDRQSEISAAQLIRQVVDTEVKAVDNDHSHWMYREHHVDPTKDVLKECVETVQGDLCRHLAEHGRPLTPVEQKQEERRIHRLLLNPDEQRRAQKARANDADEALQLLKMLPDAFRYNYDGEEASYIRLKFEPNPDFSPPTRQARVFHCMIGTVLVDPKAKRLVELRGKLFKDVDFGWGLLGRLYHGGTFLVRRADVGEGHWETTLLDVDIHGKALFFHAINAQQHEVTADYKKVADNLTLAQGASMLLSPNLQAKAAHGGGSQ